jgi:hypothetical protein
MICYEEALDEIEEFDADAPSQYSPEQELELLYFATGFMGEVKYIAKQYILSFFKDKCFCYGGSIPYSLLVSEQSLSLVINYNIINSVAKAYDSLRNHDLPLNDAKDLSEDIKLVLKVLNDLASSNIPQQFAGGMMLLYLKFVEGVQIG